MFRKKNKNFLPKKSKQERKEGKWIRSILIPGSKIPFGERIVKFLIYISLRIVIRRRKWKDPEKNFRIIDYTYKKIMSPDLIYIPSSLSFYIIMAFMPILTLIAIFLNIPFFEEFHEPAINILGGFIPGMSQILKGIQFDEFTQSHIIGITLLILVSLWISSGGFAKLIYTQSHIFNFPDTGSYWMNRIKGMLIVIFLTTFLSIALLLNIILEKYLWALIPGDTLRNAIAISIQLVVLFISVVFVILMLFKLTPTFRVKLRNILPGAFVVAIPTFLFFALFVYITSLWSYDSYGVIAVIMYIGMSALFVSNFLFMGITTNAAYNKEFVEEEVISKKLKFPKRTRADRVAMKFQRKNMREMEKQHRFEELSRKKELKKKINNAKKWTKKK